MIGPRRIGALWLDYAFATWWEVRSVLARRVPERWSEGTRAPVLLLPGVNEPWQFLRRIADRLNDAGHPIHVVRGIRYNRDTVPATAGLAQRYLEENDLRGVVLVGHSKGGLVGKHMMAVDDVDHRVDSLVTVVTPFGGSSVAKYMPLRTLRAFMPTDATISSLAANLALNGRITSIYGQFDPQIPGGSELEGATNVQLLVVGHFRLLADARVVAAVLDAVNGKQ